MDAEGALKIEDLERLTGQPKRNIRFLISEGVVPESYGKKRWASYGEEHVRALEFYAELKRQGIGSLDVIRERMAVQGDSSALVISPLRGVEVRIESSILQSMGAEALAKEIANAVEKAVNDRKGNADET